MIDLRTHGYWQDGAEVWCRAKGLPAWRAQHARLAELPVTPQCALFSLFIAGVEVPRDLLPDLDGLEAFLDRIGDRVRAQIAILPARGPHGSSYLVCDRADAGGIEVVCWPDDSSYHLLRSIPIGRRETWLDLACGSAVAQLVYPQHGKRMVASDLNPRAIRYAELGARLSRMSHLETLTGDLATVAAELVTCNAPIPGTSGPLWSATDQTFVSRAFAAAAQALAPGGMFVIHAALDAMPAPGTGELVVVAYTPDGAPREFAVAWWRPDGEARQIRARRALDATRTHLDYNDREAALAGTLSPL